MPQKVRQFQPLWLVAVIKISTIWDADLLQMKTTLLLYVIYSFADLWWETTTVVETIKLLESEGVRENDFY
jgi:hypothetical protein